MDGAGIQSSSAGEKIAIGARVWPGAGVSPTESLGNFPNHSYPIQTMNDSQLDQLLKGCDSPAPAPAGFIRDVWLRVETAESASWKPRAARLVERLLGVFALPPVAVATCTAMVVVGAWFGLQPPAANPSTEVAYIQSVSPFAHTHR